MDWAQHMKIDYGQNLRKDPVKAKKYPLKISTENYLPISQFYKTRTLQQFCLICSKLPILKIF